MLIDSQNKQWVSLTDKHHNVLDVKYGSKGESVELQLFEFTLKYLIQDPLENGESIETKFKVNRNHPEEIMTNQLEDHSDVEDPAVDWDPQEMNKPDYDDTYKPEDFKNQEVLDNVGSDEDSQNISEIKTESAIIDSVNDSTFVQENLTELFFQSQPQESSYFVQTSDLNSLYDLPSSASISDNDETFLGQLGQVNGDIFQSFHKDNSNIKSVITVQSSVRKYICQEQFISLRDAAITIQTFFRGYSARKSYNQMEKAFQYWVPDDPRFVPPHGTGFANGG